MARYFVETALSGHGFSHNSVGRHVHLSSGPRPDQELCHRRKPTLFHNAIWFLLLPVSAFVFGGLNVLLPWPISGWVIVALLAVILMISAVVVREDMTGRYGLVGVVLISVVLAAWGTYEIEAHAIPRRLPPWSWACGTVRCPNSN